MEETADLRKRKSRTSSSSGIGSAPICGKKKRTSRTALFAESLPCTALRGPSTPKTARRERGLVSFAVATSSGPMSCCSVATASRRQSTRMQQDPEQTSFTMVLKVDFVTWSRKNSLALASVSVVRFSAKTVNPALPISALIASRSGMAWGFTRQSVRSSFREPSGKKALISFSAASIVGLPCTALLVPSVPQRARIVEGARSFATPELAGPQLRSHFPTAPGPSRHRAVTPGSWVRTPTASLSLSTTAAWSAVGLRLFLPTMYRPAAAAAASTTSVMLLPSIWPFVSASALIRASVRWTGVASRCGKKNSRSRALSQALELQKISSVISICSTRAFVLSMASPSRCSITTTSLRPRVADSTTAARFSADGMNWKKALASVALR
mmetsp:Transcript_8204/g.24360  ORF Transcript_8204/g.24360 Transcript_8204/m.24360 type:complete len:384 (+) Transcript_8204:3296-4447(+)